MIRSNRRILGVVWLLLATATWCYAGPSEAAERHALVVGNGDYIHTTALKTPARDAAAIAQRLESLDFTVTLATNLDGAALADALAGFLSGLKSEDVALFYFAGHGLQFKDETYILPTDAQLQNEFRLKREGVALSDIVAQLESRLGINLLFLDASRRNPLAEALRAALPASRSTATQSGIENLPRVTGNTLILSAAGPSSYQTETPGDHSVLTHALLQHIATPDLEVEVMLKRVTGDVRAATERTQRPKRLSRLTQEFYFVPPETSASTKQAVSPPPEAPTLVSLPGGLFLMGCHRGPGCQADEQPVHAVRISPFFISRHEVTFAEWDACVTAGGCQHNPSDEGWGRGNRPVINVSWDDASEYAAWLSSATGQTWRLPTEAEWEYAARAGTNDAFAFGETLAENQANFGFRLAQTSDVGRYPANAFGLHDMHGNVWEWVGDYYDPSYYANAPVADPKGPDTGHGRVFRGGSWMYDAMAQRSSERNSFAPNFRSKNVGFRLVREP